MHRAVRGLGAQRHGGRCGARVAAHAAKLCAHGSQVEASGIFLCCFFQAFCMRACRACARPRAARARNRHVRLAHEHQAPAACGGLVLTVILPFFYFSSFYHTEDVRARSGHEANPSADSDRAMCACVLFARPLHRSEACAPCLSSRNLASRLARRAVGARTCRRSRCWR